MVNLSQSTHVGVFAFDGGFVLVQAALRGAGIGSMEENLVTI